MTTIKQIIEHLQTLDQDKEVISLVFDKENVGEYIGKDIDDEVWNNMIDYVSDHAIEQISGIIVEVHDLMIEKSQDEIKGVKCFTVDKGWHYK